MSMLSVLTYSFVAIFGSIQHCSAGRSLPFAIRLLLTAEDVFGCERLHSCAVFPAVFEQTREML